MSNKSCWFDIARPKWHLRQGGPSGGRALLWSSQWILKTSCLGATSSAWRLWNCQMCAGLPQNVKTPTLLNDQMLKCQSFSDEGSRHFTNAQFSFVLPMLFWEFLDLLCNILQIWLIVWSEVSLIAVLGHHPGWAFPPWLQWAALQEC